MTEDDLIRIERLEKSFERFNMTAAPDIDVAGSIGQGYAVNLKRAGAGATVTATGACCIGTDCSILTAAACATAGGTYQGNGTTCSPNPCTPATGACCVDTTCSITTESDCATMGGVYLGDSVPCDPDPCSSGACCLPCSDVSGGGCNSGMTEADCVARGGTFKGLGSSCDGQTLVLADTTRIPPTNETCINSLSVSADISGEFDVDGSCQVDGISTSVTFKATFSFHASSTFTRIDAIFDSSGNITNSLDTAQFFLVRYCDGSTALIVEGGQDFGVLGQSFDVVCTSSVVCDDPPCPLSPCTGSIDLLGGLTEILPFGTGVRVSAQASVTANFGCNGSSSMTDGFSGFNDLSIFDCNLCSAVGSYSYSGTNSLGASGSVTYSITTTIG